MARTPITSDNLSPLILILTWFWCIVSVLCFGARAATKAIFSRSLSIEDYSSCLSLVSSMTIIVWVIHVLIESLSIKICNIAQSVAVTIRTSNGLGKHVFALQPSQISAYEKVVLTRPSTNGTTLIKLAHRLPMLQTFST